MSKRFVLPAAALLLLGIAAVWMFYGDDGRVEAREKPSTRLFVQTTPPGAKVFLNGEQQEGTSDRLFVVPPGVTRMVVEVELDAHHRGRKTVEIEGGRITRVELELGKSADKALDLESPVERPSGVNVPPPAIRISRPVVSSVPECPKRATASLSLKRLSRSTCSQAMAFFAPLSFQRKARPTG